MDTNTCAYSCCYRMYVSLGVRSVKRSALPRRAQVFPNIPGTSLSSKRLWRVKNPELPSHACWVTNLGQERTRTPLAIPSRPFTNLEDPGLRTPSLWHRQLALRIIYVWQLCVCASFSRHTCHGSFISATQPQDSSEPKHSWLPSQHIGWDGRSSLWPRSFCSCPSAAHFAYHRSAVVRFLAQLLRFLSHLR